MKQNNNSHITAEWILRETLQRVAPLPSQRGYARALASIFSMHIHRNELMDDGISADDLPATAALVVAPSGQGKSYIFRKMAEVVGQNVVTIDCSTLTAEGWKGISLSNRLGSVRHELRDDHKFARSLIFFDEFDKLRTWGTHADQGNAVVNILQLFNGAPIAVEVGKNTEHIDVSRFTIILGGAFYGLEDIIRERTRPKTRIGFGCDAGKTMDSAEAMGNVTIEDLQKYGFSPEILGRIGTILSIPKLGLEDHRQLLTAKTGSLHQRYRNYLWNLYGCEFEISDAAATAIAQRCMAATIGARAANSIVNDLMRTAVAEVENHETICKVILDAEADGCIIRYEHGTRAYAFRNPARRTDQEGEHPWHTIRAKSPAALTRKLLRYYRNAGGPHSAQLQLECFLDCVTTYLFHRLRPEEQTFDSLEKLARVMDRRGNPRSPFEIILSDASRVIPEDARNRMQSVYTSDLQRNLTAALQVIMAYIEQKHGPCRVRFEIRHGNPAT